MSDLQVFTRDELIYMWLIIRVDIISKHILAFEDCWRRPGRDSIRNGSLIRKHPYKLLDLWRLIMSPYATFLWASTCACFLIFFAMLSNAQTRKPGRIECNNSGIIQVCRKSRIVNRSHCRTNYSKQASTWDMEQGIKNWRVVSKWCVGGDKLSLRLSDTAGLYRRTLGTSRDLFSILILRLQNTLLSTSHRKHEGWKWVAIHNQPIWKHC